MKIALLDYRKNYYTYERSIVNKVPQADYAGVHDFFSLANRLARKVNALTGRSLINTFDLNNQFQDFGLNDYDLLHLFNGVSYARKPWVTGFETVVPRLSAVVTRHQGEQAGRIAFKGQVQRAFKALAGQPCKALLPWSNNAALIQNDLLAEIPAELAERIRAKIQVLHPPQSLTLAGFDQKEFDFSHKLRLMLVGAGFFRKGGREILEVCEQLVRQQGYPLELIIVSSLYMDHYAAHESEADLRQAQAKIQANADWIRHYPKLPNPEVLELMKQAHVGLLPTYADTYGLSVLDFQAAGCPVISTNVRALPEMNNNQVGWLIEVPRNPLGEALYTTPAEREQLGAQIRAGLQAALEEISAQPEVILHKGRAAFEKVQNEHDPVQYARQLLAVYQAALGQPTP